MSYSAWLDPFHENIVLHFIMLAIIKADIFSIWRLLSSGMWCLAVRFVLSFREYPSFIYPDHWGLWFLWNVSMHLPDRTITSRKTVIFSHYHENLVAPILIIWGWGGRVWAGNVDMVINSTYKIAWWNFFLKCMYEEWSISRFPTSSKLNKNSLQN